MNKEKKSEIKYRMKRLARKFCRRNNVYESFDGSVGELIEKSYFSAYLLCLHENKNKIAELEKENAELKETLKTYNGCGDWDNDFHTCRVYLQHEELQEYIDQLTKAKEIIKKLKALYLTPVVTKDDVKRQDVILNEAEQFLNSEVKK